MAELTTEARDRLRDSSFAYIDREGERHLPINDADHVRNAISRFNQTDFQSKTAKHSAARTDPRRGEAPRHRGRRRVRRGEGRQVLAGTGAQAPDAAASVSSVMM